MGIRYLIIYTCLGVLFSCSPKEEKIAVTIFPSEWCFSTKTDNIQYLTVSTKSGIDVKMYSCENIAKDTTSLSLIYGQPHLLCTVYQQKKGKRGQVINKIYTFWFESDYWKKDSVEITAQITKF